MDRIDQELELLRSVFPNLDCSPDRRFVRLPGYGVPAAGIWKSDRVTLALQFPAGYPGQKPYGFFVNPPLELLSGGTIANVTPSTEPPWPGPWLKFSWDPPEWQPTEDVYSGSNMLNFVLTFADRLREGA